MQWVRAIPLKRRSLSMDLCSDILSHERMRKYIRRHPRREVDTGLASDIVAWELTVASARRIDR